MQDRDPRLLHAVHGGVTVLPTSNIRPSEVQLTSGCIDPDTCLSTNPSARAAIMSNDIGRMEPSRLACVGMLVHLLVLVTKRSRRCGMSSASSRGRTHPCRLFMRMQLKNMTLVQLSAFQQEDADHEYASVGCSPPCHANVKIGK